MPKSKINRTIAMFIAVIFLGCSLSVTSYAFTAREISDFCSSAVFYIEVTKDDSVVTGSGFFINQNGVAVTNYHVVKDAVSAKITTVDGSTFDVAESLYYSVERDIAIIKVSKTSVSGETVNEFPYLKMKESSSVCNGDVVYAIGSPKGLQNSISDGIVSNRERYLEGEKYPYIQVSAPISNGSSGGALINESGFVIGITSAGITLGQNLNLAVPLDSILAFNCNSEGIPFTELRNKVKKVPDLGERIVHEKNPENTDNNYENINNGDTVIGTFASAENVDFYQFTLYETKKCEFYCGGIAETATSYEKNIFSSLMAGIFDEKGNYINELKMFADDDGSPYGYLSESLSAGIYYIAVLYDPDVTYSWGYKQYFVYMYYEEEPELINPLPEYRVGDVVNEAVYTDIVAYINGYPINSYNINGNTAIIAEDLMNYGFSLNWNQEGRRLTVNNDYFYDNFNPPKSINPTLKEFIGIKAFDVLYTDITTYIGSIKVPSFCIKGQTLIYIDDLNSLGTVSWNQNTRSICLNIDKLPDENYQYIKYSDYDFVPDFKRISNFENKIEESPIESGFRYKALNNFTVNYDIKKYEYYLKQLGYKENTDRENSYDLTWIEKSIVSDRLMIFKSYIEPAGGHIIDLFSYYANDIQYLIMKIDSYVNYKDIEGFYKTLKIKGYTVYSQEDDDGSFFNYCEQSTEIINERYLGKGEVMIAPEFIIEKAGNDVIVTGCAYVQYIFNDGNVIGNVVMLTITYIGGNPDNFTIDVKKTD